MGYAIRDAEYGMPGLARTFICHDRAKTSKTDVHLDPTSTLTRLEDRAARLPVDPTSTQRRMTFGEGREDNYSQWADAGAERCRCGGHGLPRPIRLPSVVGSEGYARRESRCRGKAGDSLRLDSHPRRLQSSAARRFLAWHRITRIISWVMVSEMKERAAASSSPPALLAPRPPARFERWAGAWIGLRMRRRWLAAGSSARDACLFSGADGDDCGVETRWR
ncbi:hypothetical protein DFH06DRAFT_55582 [Mycena polygramma]|nr:hypothetical protein DFH06DRAFT_55582 [Mycena polygramma]